MFYNGITTRVPINNGRFRMVWRSPCNGGQKGERRERPVKIASDIHVHPYAERFGCKKNSLSFALQCLLRTQKEILANLRPF